MHARLFSRAATIRSCRSRGGQLTVQFFVATRTAQSRHCADTPRPPPPQQQAQPPLSSPTASNTSEDERRSSSATGSNASEMAAEVAAPATPSSGEGAPKTVDSTNSRSAAVPPQPSSTTPPPTSPPPASPVLDVDLLASASTPPKGFQRYFTKELVARITGSATNPARGIRSARQMTSDELIIARSFETYQVRQRQYRRLAILALLAGGLSVYRYWQFTGLASDEATANYAKVVVDLHSHFANFYDAANTLVAHRSFVDFLTLEASIPVDKDVLINVVTYYPVVPMLLLLLLPLMAGMNSGFTASARMAGREARNSGAIGDKPKFNFKREVGITTRLKDVAGLTEAKHEVVEVVDFLKNPQKYRKLGATLPKGVLLDGPPGVGKTLLAKAIAGEAMVPFVSCSGSEFEEVFVGVGAQRVRELFRQAHKAKPCVVFIDEIDAFGKKRKTDGTGSSRTTLNAFLSELDGFHDSTGIIVLAATNRADVLDQALTRSGRFDRKITLEKPPHKDRVAIAMVHLRPLKLDPSIPIDSFAETIASLTAGCSGADIFNICNEAAIVASREDRDFINVECFHKALERVLVGLEKQAVKLVAHERERVAHHEAGHVVLSWFQKTTDPVIKTTITPRGGHMTGVTQKLPHNVFISTQEALHEAIVARLGGFVAEEHFFKDLSSNAAEDLQMVTDMARNEVCRYGMAPETVGHFGYNMDQENAIQKPYGPAKENVIDQEIAKIVGMSLTRARQLLQSRLLEVRKVAGLLMKQETLSGHDLWLILGDRPVMTKEFLKYLQS